MGDRLEGLRIVLVDDEAGHLVAFIGNDGLGEEYFEGEVGERHLRRHALLVVACGNSREVVA